MVGGRWSGWLGAWDRAELELGVLAHFMCLYGILGVVARPMVPLGWHVVLVCGAECARCWGGT